MTHGHKLIVSYDTADGLHKMPPRELYDLANDPSETHNLSGDPIIEQDITIGKGYRAWLKEHDYW